MEMVDCSFLTELFDSLENAVVLADSSGCVFLRNRLAVKLLGDVSHVSQAWGRLELDPKDDGQFRKNSRRALCNSPFGAHPVRLQVLDLAGSGAIAMVITPASELDSPRLDDHRTGDESLTVARAAHELNNPLDGMGRFLSLAAKAIDSGDGQQAGQFIARAQDGLKHLKSTLARMLESSAASGESHNCELPEIIIQQSIDAMSESLSAGNIALVCDIRCDDDIMIDTQAFGILCNLIKNACQCGSTRITIKCRFDGGRVSISVSDNGPGIDAELRERIFESFYTTKADGHGLGLAVSRSQARTLGGELVCDENPSGGAVFTLSLPPAHRPKRQLAGGR